MACVIIMVVLIWAITSPSKHFMATYVTNTLYWTVHLSFQWISCIELFLKHCNICNAKKAKWRYPVGNTKRYQSGTYCNWLPFSPTYIPSHCLGGRMESMWVTPHQPAVYPSGHLNTDVVNFICIPLQTQCNVKLEWEKDNCLQWENFTIYPSLLLEWITKVSVWYLFSLCSLEQK